MKTVKLFFDPATHTYTDDEHNVYTSVTTAIGGLIKEYDKRYWSMYRALEETGYKCRPDKSFQYIYIYSKNNPFDPWKPFTIDELYEGIIQTKRSVENITSEWQYLNDVACDWGDEKHSYLEECVNDFYKEHKGVYVYDDTVYNARTSSFRYKIVNEEQLKNSPLIKSHPSIYRLLWQLIKSNYTLYAEKRVYSYDHRISGTIDILAMRGKDFLIVDWKTNKDELQFESGYFKKVWNAARTDKIKTDEWVKTDERFKDPISNLQYCKGNMYALQLSMYAYLCELWGYKCQGLILCHIRHKETRKRDSENSLTVDKKEIPPRIYPDIKYLKHEAKLICEYNKAVKVDGVASKQFIQANNSTRGAIALKP
jgi:hypothetical protein